MAPSTATPTSASNPLAGTAAVAYVGLLMASSHRGFRINTGKVIADARAASRSLAALNRLRRAARTTATRTFGRIVPWRHRPVRAAAPSSRRRRSAASHAKLSVARPRRQAGQ